MLFNTSKFYCRINLTAFFLIFSGLIFGQSVGIKDFEKMPLITKPADYFLKKDFVVKSDSSDKAVTKLRLYNRGTREWVYLFSSKKTEAVSVEVQYFTPDSEEYGKIARSIVKAGYSAIGNVRNYEKRVSSYEWHSIVLKELEYIKDREYYGIVYKYFSGKELSMPPPSTDK